MMHYVKCIKRFLCKEGVQAAENYALNLKATTQREKGFSLLISITKVTVLVKKCSTI